MVICVARNDQSGFTYLSVLFLVAVMGIALAATGMLWSTAQQREKERELLLVGDQLRKAIGQYYEKSPGAVKKYPNTLNDLLKDERQLATQRYLRKIFIDPMTRTNKWGLVQAPEGGIMGVYSLSENRPLKTANFSEANLALEGRIKYSEWLFVYTPVK
ncbi:MAG: type II secretion system protein [Nitrosomonadales bacterium]|nr:type II secretion system protein [Nitrosomonadales bacterium]